MRGGIFIRSSNFCSRTPQPLIPPQLESAPALASFTRVMARTLSSGLVAALCLCAVATTASAADVFSFAAASQTTEAYHITATAASEFAASDLKLSVHEQPQGDYVLEVKLGGASSYLQVRTCRAVGHSCCGHPRFCVYGASLLAMRTERCMPPRRPAPRSTWLWIA